VRVICDCGAVREIEPEALARLVGWSVTTKELAQRMRCSQCGKKAGISPQDEPARVVPGLAPNTDVSPSWDVARIGQGADERPREYHRAMSVREHLLYQEAKAAFAWQRSPLGQALSAHVNEFFSYPRFAEMEPESKQELVTDLHQRVNEILQAENPVIKLRESLANYMILHAELAVLCLTEEEKRDQFYADCPFISGQLHREIQKAVPHVEFLREAKCKFPDVSAEEFVALCNARSIWLLFYVNGFNDVRYYLKDCDKEDWFHPFNRAMMIWHEDWLRGKMGLPCLLPDKLDELKYATFVNLVVDGAPNPYCEWERAWAHSPPGYAVESLDTPLQRHRR